MKREPGYYFVKVQGTWIVAVWVEGSWGVPFSEHLYSDNYFEEIDPKPIKRD